MPRIDFGHFYRFLVSAGLFVVAGALVLPWFVLREITADGLAAPQNPSPVAESLANSRLEHLSWIVAIYPWVSLVGIAFGVFLVVLGLVRWKRRQDVADKREDIKLGREKLVYDAATKEQRAVKDEVESAEVNAEELAAPEEPVLDMSASEASDKPVAEPTKPPLTAQLLREVEDGVLAAITAALGGLYRVETHVRFKTPQGPVFLDAVASPSDASLPTVAIEIKFSRVGFSAMRLSEALLTLARAIGDRRGHPRVVGLLICVIDETGEPRFARRTTQSVERARADAEALGIPASVVTVGLHEIGMDGGARYKGILIDAITDAVGRGRDQRGQ
jgi:hypothetical protein